MKWKRFIPFALVFALLAGCAGPSGGGVPDNTGSPTPSVSDSPTPSASNSPSPEISPTGSPAAQAPVADLSAYALASPIYPEFPIYPEQPEDGESWDTYFDAENEYFQAVQDLRSGADAALTQGLPELIDFAARSTPLAIKGHEGENAIYSPVSLWSALIMAAQCANGESQEQLLAALGAADAETLRNTMRQVWLALYTDDGRDALTLGNSVWLSNNAKGHYVQDTLDTLARDCFSGVYSIPMGTAEADQAITEWISEQTHGLIGDSGPVVETEALTLAVLASSLYYRAGWRDEFHEANTWEDTFTAAGGGNSQVDFMHRSENGLFLDQDGYQAASLSTRLGEMVFVLPDEGITPESLLNDPDFLGSLQFTDPDVRQGEVQWSVPKFDVDSNLDLLDTLKSLGITDLLDPNIADLSNLTDISAYLSDAYQLARVKVDEEGVEAAGVTILMMDECAALIPEEQEICVMDLDRPFLFVVRSHDLPLFVGVVNQVG